MQILYINDVIPSDKSFTITRHHFKKGDKVGVHSHTFFELEITLDGRGYNVINGVQYEFEKNSVWITGENDIHNLTCLEEVTILNFSFYKEVIKSTLIESITNNMPIASKLSDDKLENILFELDGLGDINGEEIKLLKSVNIIENLLISLLNLKSEKTQENNTILKQALNITGTRYFESLSLSSISVELGVTPNYLGYLFKKYTRKNFNDHLNDVRISRACYLLKCSKLPIKDIATQCGFNSIEYFYYVFKKSIKKPPKQYIKE